MAEGDGEVRVELAGRVHGFALAAGARELQCVVPVHARLRVTPPATPILSRDQELWIVFTPRGPADGDALEPFEVCVQPSAFVLRQAAEPLVPLGTWEVELQRRQDSSEGAAPQPETLGTPLLVRVTSSLPLDVPLE